MQAILPIIQETNDSVEQVFESQVSLSKQLCLMAAQLEEFTRDHPAAPSLAPKLESLRQAQQRMKLVNEKLLVIQGLWCFNTCLFSKDVTNILSH
jgi:hypothetical protein